MASTWFITCYLSFSGLRSQLHCLHVHEHHVRSERKMLHHRRTPCVFLSERIHRRSPFRLYKVKKHVPVQKKFSQFSLFSLLEPNVWTTQSAEDTRTARTADAWTSVPVRAVPTPTATPEVTSRFALAPLDTPEIHSRRVEGSILVSTAWWCLP